LPQRRPGECDAQALVHAHARDEIALPQRPPRADDPPQRLAIRLWPRGQVVDLRQDRRELREALPLDCAQVRKRMPSRPAIRFSIDASASARLATPSRAIAAVMPRRSPAADPRRRTSRPRRR